MLPQLTVSPGYKPQSLDTTVEVDLLNFWLLRQRTPEQRLSMGTAMNQNARQFSINCFRQRFSPLSNHQLAQKLAQAWLGEDSVYQSQIVSTYNLMSWIQDSISLAGRLHPILVSLNIPYYITGGVAAIAYGEVRTTRDLDVVIFIQPQDINELRS